MRLRGKVSFLPATLLASTTVSYSQSGGTYTQIDYPGALKTTIQGVNTAGELVGCYDTGDLNFPWIPVQQWNLRNYRLSG